VDQATAKALKLALRDQECLLATWLTRCDPMMVEAIASGGFDTCILDTEHGPITAAGALMTQIIADRCGVPLLVRVPGPEPTAIAAALDNGAAGVVVPRVQSAAQAAEAIAMAHYPPRGSRGFGPRRASGYLRRVDDYLNRAHESTIVIVQVETKGAIDEIDQILALPDLDGILVGRNDLSMELGLPRDPADPRLTQITRDLLGRARAAGLGAGIASAGRVEAALAARDLGANLVAAGIDVEYLATAIDAFVQQARSQIDHKQE